jgi:hypothetical protein
MVAYVMQAVEKLRINHLAGSEGGEKSQSAKKQQHGIAWPHGSFLRLGTASRRDVGDALEPDLLKSRIGDVKDVLGIADALAAFA